MKIEQLLAHHGIQSNPFADEDAQTDTIFKDHCIATTYHPSWDKIYGNPAEPSTSIVFGEKGSVVVDPTEEKMRDEFEGVEALFLPMHSVLSIEKVKKRGQAVIRDRKSGEKVTPFPLTPHGRSKN